MAPILSTAIGVTPQIVDDPKLAYLIETLNGFQTLAERKPADDLDNVDTPVDVDKLVKILEPYETWPFEEQVSQVYKTLSF